MEWRGELRNRLVRQVGRVLERYYTLRIGKDCYGRNGADWIVWEQVGRYMVRQERKVMARLGILQQGQVWQVGRVESGWGAF